MLRQLFSAPSLTLSWDERSIGESPTLRGAWMPRFTATSLFYSSSISSSTKSHVCTHVRNCFRLNGKPRRVWIFHQPLCDPSEFIPLGVLNRVSRPVIVSNIKQIFSVQTLSNLEIPFLHFFRVVNHKQGMTQTYLHTCTFYTALCFYFQRKLLWGD